MIPVRLLLLITFTVVFSLLFTKISADWIYQGTFSNTNCATDSVIAQLYTPNVCFPTTSGTTGILFGENGTALTIKTFSQPTCSGTGTVLASFTPPNCGVNANSTSTLFAIKPSLPSPTQHSVIFSYFASSSLCASTPASNVSSVATAFTAYAFLPNSNCFNDPGSPSGLSKQWTTDGIYRFIKQI